MKYEGDDDVSTLNKVQFEKFLNLEFSTRKHVSLKKCEDQRTLCCPLFALAAWKLRTKLNAQ